MRQAVHFFYSDFYNKLKRNVLLRKKEVFYPLKKIVCRHLYNKKTVVTGKRFDIVRKKIHFIAFFAPSAKRNRDKKDTILCLVKI